MATKKLEGITIEIAGNTTKLTNSLKDVDSAIASTSKELKNINSLLKIDPGNMTLLAQKSKALTDAIGGTEEKLKQLRIAKQQADERIASGAEDKNSASYRELEREIIATEQKLKKLNGSLSETKSEMQGSASETNKFKDAADDASKSTLKFGDVLKANLLSTAISKGLSTIVDGMKKVASASAQMVKDIVTNFADYEQLVGGIETLFKDSADVVEEYANNAFKTAGLSANEYMETVTSFSASLLQSLDGDTKKSADAADQAIRDMSDNANKMGTDMEMIQNAYQGFAKQNYTMLDNLKLGYGGTKTEMQRLLEDATAISGVEYDIKSLNDVYEAIHVIQGELGITGTTAKEASSTISGSINTMKSSYQNLLTGLGKDNADFGKLIDDFIESILNVVKNIGPVISRAIKGIAQVLPTLIVELLPQLVEMGMGIINGIIDGITLNGPLLLETIFNALSMLVQQILTMLPQLLQMGIQLIVQLSNGIAKQAPTLIPQIINTLVSLVTTLLDNLDLIIDAGIELIMGLAEGIVIALPQLIEKTPVIIDKLVTGLADNLPKLMQVGPKLIIELAAGIIKSIPSLLKAIPPIITSLVKGFGNYVSNLMDIGKNIVSGIWKGISNGTDWIKGKIKEWVGNVTDFLKKLFGIKSPSRVMRDEVGKYLAQGIGVGFEREMPNTIRDIENAMAQLNTGIQASINPTINPQANSNPLIIEIENFNNSRETDIQSLAEELEFYRKNSALAVGGK